MHQCEHISAIHDIKTLQYLTDTNVSFITICWSNISVTAKSIVKAVSKRYLTRPIRGTRHFKYLSLQLHSMLEMALQSIQIFPLQHRSQHLVHCYTFPYHFTFIITHSAPQYITMLHIPLLPSIYRSRLLSTHSYSLYIYINTLVVLPWSLI